jgi:hypothetical protein
MRHSLFAGQRNYRRVSLCQRRMPEQFEVGSTGEMEFALNIHDLVSYGRSTGNPNKAWPALQEMNQSLHGNALC